MSYFQTYAPVANFLILHDVDTTSASLVAEKFVTLSAGFDAIIVVGPFIHTDAYKKEDLATAEGDMASTIAQLENVTCRVIYLAADTDPPNSLIQQLHLTPNSVNIYARRLTLRDGLFITGHTETSEDMEVGKVPEHADRSDESDDELDNVEVKSSTESMNIIREILKAGKAQQQKEMQEAAAHSPEAESSSSSSHLPFAGIFVMNYKHVHTLNYFLFHMADELNQAGVNVCIIPNVSEEALRLPRTVMGKHLVVPRSLRNGGHYATLRMEQTPSAGTNSSTSSWQATQVEYFTL